MSMSRRALALLAFSWVCAQAQACIDASGTDSGGDACEYYNTHPYHCGCCDTSTFSASGCCSCQGSPVTGDTTWWTGVFLAWPSKATALRLPGKGIEVDLPTDVAVRWPHLTKMDLSKNRLTGSLPRQLGSLSDLTTLDLYGNSLTGTLPMELFQLSKLEYLDLSSNQLRGSLPPEVGNWTSMRKLYLEKNQFSGSLPAELGRLKSFYRLYLYSNRFSGSLPAELFQLPNLRSLDLYNNQFSGSLPAELGQLSQLETLELSFNAFTGPIPVEIGRLWQVKRVFLENNKFHGSLPRELCNLTSMNRIQGLYLEDNELSGELPRELGGLLQLQRLRLQNNKFTGLLPAELGNLTGLWTLRLENNALSGSIPPELGNISSLDELRLGSNNLTGPLPSELGRLSRLKILQLSHNQLSGPVPLSFGKLKQVHDFDASDNPLLCGGGEAFEGMTSLTRLVLGGCCFEDLPGLPEGLEHLDVAKNRLRKVPRAWWGEQGLPSLRTLHLNGNNVAAWDTSGIVPQEQFVGDMWICGFRPSGARVAWPSLELLDVSSNPLALPVYDFLYSLGHLPKLSVLLARATNLSGGLPATHCCSLVFDVPHTGDNCSNAPTPHPGFPALNTLDLAQNSITTLLASAPVQLVQADFSGNALVELAPRWWQGGPGGVLQRVDVRSNPELRLHVRLNASSSCPALGAQEPTAEAREWSKSLEAPRAECTRLCPMEKTGLIVDAAVDEMTLCRCTQGLGAGINCSLCPPDTYSNLSMEAGHYRRTCLQCPAHSHLEGGEGLCFADCHCEAGFHMVQTLLDRDYDVSALPCSRLPPAGRCVSCGIFKTSPVGSREEADCHCNSNAEAGGWLGLIEREGRCGCPDGFHMDFLQRSCIECKPEEDCGDWTESLAPPRVRAGFWSLSPPPRGDGTFGNFTSHSIWRCQSKTACPGNAECGENRTGTACSLCRAGHFLTPWGSCSPCPQGPAGARRMLAVLWVASMTLPLLAHFQLRRDIGHARVEGLSTTLGPFRTSMKQLLNFVQILNLVSLFRVEWPAAADPIFALTRIFSVDVAVAGSGVACLDAQQQQTVTLELAFRWMLPVAGILSTCSAALLLNLARPVLVRLAQSWSGAQLSPKRETKLRELLEFGPLDILRVFVFFLNLLFPSLLKNALLPLTCSPSPNGLLTMSFFPHMSCSLSASGAEGDAGGSYKALALVGLAQSVLLSLGFPVVLFFVLRRVDASSSNLCESQRELRQRRWAFLFLAFRRHKRSWLLVTVSKDILLNLLVVFLPGLGTAQLLATAFISIAYACRAFCSRPFPEVTNSLLETCTAVAVASLCLFTAGVGFQSEPDVDTPDLGTYVRDGPEGGGHGYFQRAMALVFLQGFSFALPLVIIFFQLLLLFPATRRCVPRFLRPLSDEQRAEWSRQFTTSMDLGGGPLPRALAELDAVDFGSFRQAVLAAPLARTTLGRSYLETDDEPDPVTAEDEEDSTEDSVDSAALVPALRAQIADLKVDVRQRDEEMVALRQEMVALQGDVRLRDEELVALRQEIALLKEAADVEMDRVAFEI